MNQSPTISAAAELISKARELYVNDRPATRVLDELDRRLHEPLRLAVAGIVKAGKSTLLNAVLGERIAPTDAGECTRVVTWYRYADTPSITLHPKEGQPQRLPVRRKKGQLLLDLDGRNADEVERIDITWPSPALRRVILIDTPGIASLSENVSARSLHFLTPDQTPSSADAIVYLLRHLHPSDLNFLEAFRDTAAGSSRGINAVAVLSRADEIGSGRIDSLLSARKVARRYELDGELSSLALSVVPVAGLLAEGARTLRESEYTAFRELAGLDRANRERLLISADRFVRPADFTSLSEQDRRALLARFGMFGVRLATSLVRAGVSDSSDLAEQLVQQSGLNELSEFVGLQFHSRAEALKTRTILDGLERLMAVNPRSEATELEAGIERMRLNAYGVHELAVISQAHVSGLSLPPAETADAVRIVGGSGLDAATRLGLDEQAEPAVIADRLAVELDRWRVLSVSPVLDRATAEACQVVLRSLEQIASDIKRAGTDQPPSDVVAAGTPGDTTGNIAGEQGEQDEQ
ncbi:MAG: dynamin family protein [Brooklawnia sp.]